MRLMRWGPSLPREGVCPQFRARLMRDGWVPKAGMTRRLRAAAKAGGAEIGALASRLRSAMFSTARPAELD